MAIRNEFLHRNAQATGFGDLDLAPSACTLASRLLPHSPLRAARQIGCRVEKSSLTISRKRVGIWAGLSAVLSAPRGKNFFSLSLRGPTQTNETILWVVGDEDGPLIVAGDPALVLERILCKRRSGGRLLQESWSIGFQTFPV